MLLYNAVMIELNLINVDLEAELMKNCLRSNKKDERSIVLESLRDQD